MRQIQRRYTASVDPGASSDQWGEALIDAFDHGPGGGRYPGSRTRASLTRFFSRRHAGDPVYITCIFSEPPALIESLSEGDRRRYIHGGGTGEGAGSIRYSYTFITQLGRLRELVRQDYDLESMILRECRGAFTEEDLESLDETLFWVA